MTETTDPLRAMIATATDVYYYGDAGTEREWRQCRFCLAYAEGEVGSKPTPRHGEPCPVGDLEHICDDTCPANEYHERTHAPLALHAASAPSLSPDLREQLAALCHEQWSGWMKYVFSRTHPNILLNAAKWIPPDWAERWKRQMETPFAELSDSEKESDRAEADRILALLQASPASPPRAWQPKDGEK